MFPTAGEAYNNEVNKALGLDGVSAEVVKKLAKLKPEIIRDVLNQ